MTKQKLMFPNYSCIYPIGLKLTVPLLFQRILLFPLISRGPFQPYQFSYSVI